MKLAEYMDPARFPRTTQTGLSPREQFRLDAVNYDDLTAHRESGKPINNPDDAATAAELDAKMADRDGAMDEMKELPDGGNAPWRG
jgi:hypothetical protein